MPCEAAYPSIDAGMTMPVLCAPSNYWNIKAPFRQLPPPVSRKPAAPSSIRASVPLRYLHFRHWRHAMRSCVSFEPRRCDCVSPLCTIELLEHQAHLQWSSTITGNRCSDHCKIWFKSQGVPMISQRMRIKSPRASRQIANFVSTFYHRAVDKRIVTGKESTWIFVKL